MQKESLKYGAVGLALGAVIVWFGMATLGNSSTPGFMGMRGSQTQIETSRIDAHFIEQMIPHHEDAVTMSKLALTKAKRSEVKQLAESIIDSQSKEIEQMKIWHKDWYGRDLPTGSAVMNQHGMMGTSDMHMGTMGDSTDTQRLENAADFDRAFVEDMIPHHQMAIMMAQMLQQGTDRPEMKQLAGDIISAQEKEIVQMRAWLKEWSQ